MKRVIIDLDAGTDDAVALLLFLHAEKLGKIKIEALICTNGNTSLDNVCKNVVRLLESINRTDIPIYKGAYHQLLPFTLKFKQYHGSDGFGGLKYEKDPDVSVIREECSAVALHRIVSRYPNEISLICLGPLTNLAVPMRLYKDFTGFLKEIYIMGGNYCGVGNTTAAAEFNFCIDPEAASIVFECATCPIYLLPWECCKNSNISFKWRYDVLGKIERPFWKLIDNGEKAVYGPKPDTPNWMPCDAYAALAFLYPEKGILLKRHDHVSVELHGTKTRGQVVIDHLDENENNAVIIEKINEEYFKEILYEACHSV